jgi:hypothetical protein
MAKTLYSFIHPSDGNRYFYIINTFYELPEIVPLDLSTFIWYWTRTHNNINPIPQIYDDLKNYGTSLPDYSFNELQEKEKQMVYNLVFQAGTNYLAIRNSELNSKIDDYLQNPNEIINEKKISRLLRESSFESIRPISYFASWNHTRNSIEELSLSYKWENIESLIYKQDNKSVDQLAKTFLMYCEKSFPLTAVPHLLRHNKIVNDYLQRKNYTHLLPISDCRKEERVVRHIPIHYKPNKEMKADFFDATYSCNFGIADYYKKSVHALKKKRDELSETDISVILEKELGSDFDIFNLRDSKEKKILPNIYHHVQEYKWDENILYAFSKYGIQAIDIISAWGKLLLEDAYDIDSSENNLFVITDHQQKKSLYQYNNTSDELYFIGPYDTDYPILYSENKFFYKGGFVNENLEPCTPSCFDDEKEYHQPGIYFSEGLAPVCLDGKWGYINHRSEIIIPFLYGDALPFQNGKAIVFELEKKYQITTGIWQEQSSHLPNSGLHETDKEAFFRKFPGFPKTIRKPLTNIRGIKSSQLDFMLRYHSFAYGMQQFNYDVNSLDLSVFGKWIYIDNKGNFIEEIIPDATPSRMPNIENGVNYPSDHKEKQVQEKSYWIEKIKKDESAANYLPDELYSDREFVSSVVKIQPRSYKFFISLYSEDKDIGSIALQLFPQNYSYFSESLKAYFRDEHNELTKDKKDSDEELPF